MRLYLEHRKAYNSYVEASANYEKVINEYEVIAQRIQPRNALAEHEREFSNETVLPATSVKVNKAEEYAIAMEQSRINERLQTARTILQERAILLSLKEEELRKSRDIYNLVYCMKWVDGLKADAIVVETGYSRSQVYNIIGHLTKQLERSEL